MFFSNEMKRRAWLLTLSLIALMPVNAQAEAVEYYGAGDLPFSEAVQVGDMLYLSGQIGVEPGGVALVQGGIDGETRQAMENIRAILARRSLTYDAIVKCTAMLSDMKDWPAFNKVYVSYFQRGRLPARSAFAANGIAFGGKIELECWAYNPAAAH